MSASSALQVDQLPRRATVTCTHSRLHLTCKRHMPHPLKHLRPGSSSLFRRTKLTTSLYRSHSMRHPSIYHSDCTLNKMVKSNTKQPWEALYISPVDRWHGIGSDNSSDEERDPLVWEYHILDRDCGVHYQRRVMVTFPSISWQSVGDLQQRTVSRRCACRYCILRASTNAQFLWRWSRDQMLLR